MPQGRGKSKRKPKKPAQPEMNAVLVTVTDVNGGGRGVEVSTIGNIKLTEAATLLKLGAKAAEKQLGLES